MDGATSGGRADFQYPTGGDLREDTMIKGDKRCDPQKQHMINPDADAYAEVRVAVVVVGESHMNESFHCVQA
ncbi:hypothetical protein E2C01_047943 [Portunus trituberculatus]|uniref:Uncharacterized protein n=1 Tax=Portunus trituberculatus TaxID=210409 RepID=A0A5B7G986_PORTR|nr:hypothetical protein [Portunus trituberculatus]